MTSDFEQDVRRPQTCLCAVRQTNPGGQRAARCLCWMLRPKRTFCGAARCMNSISEDTGGEFRVGSLFMGIEGR